eukprot:TRINITY_DN30873_c0_g1_i1.p1 TRINITY_DN30873_c0_g1~~TRINITY_DN30873_c0_g1_i1.p1  ORF type:complete len:226 (-),score=71.67 TRINITY_DN30873_c0_g1_i1:163-783(-)
MASKGVWFLKKLTIQYCEHGGSSRGIRDLINSSLAQFRETNPQLVVEIKKRNGRHPCAYAEYHTGNEYQWPLRNKSSKEALEVLYELRNRRGRKVSTFFGWPTARTQVPSVQGRWRADLHPAPVVLFNAKHLPESEFLEAKEEATQLVSAIPGSEVAIEASNAPRVAPWVLPISLQPSKQSVLASIKRGDVTTPSSNTTNKFKKSA